MPHPPPGCSSRRPRHFAPGQKVFRSFALRVEARFEEDQEVKHLPLHALRGGLDFLDEGLC
ncbi:MAG: hypothetical protein QM845_17125, partial [Verrucomicrobiota bacterium]|nr:hypothetical protein [Verrucomicrobiota bacterium]